jgi:phosphopantetheinyl transferase (holo-ACP synthase)
MKVGRKETGESYVILHRGGQTLLQGKGGRHLLVSLSHTQTYAAAAILEGASRE